MIKPGDFITVDSPSSSFDGCLFEVEKFGHKSFTYSVVIGPVGGNHSHESEVFNLDYNTNQSWEKEATISKANSFKCFIEDDDSWDFKRVDVKPIARTISRRHQFNKHYYDVHLIAENKTHFQIYDYYTVGGSDEVELVILSKKDYEYSEVQGMTNAG